MTTILPCHVFTVYLADSLNYCYILGNVLDHWRCARLAQLVRSLTANQEVPGSRPGRGLNFEIPSFATPPVDIDIKPLVQSISRRSIGERFKKEPTYLSIRVG